MAGFLRTHFPFGARLLRQEALETIEDDGDESTKKFAGLMGQFARLSRAPFNETAKRIRDDPTTFPKFERRSVWRENQVDTDDMQKKVLDRHSQIALMYDDLIRSYGSEHHMDFDNWEVDRFELGSIFGKSSLIFSVNKTIDSVVRLRTPKSKIWWTFEDPSFSTLAWWLQMYIMALILLAVVVLVLETMNPLADNSAWPGLEIFLVVNFTLEYCIRFWSSPDKVAFMKGILNGIDLLAILPFYVEAILGAVTGQLTGLRILRLARGFRVFKFGRHSKLLGMFGAALYEARQALHLLITLIVVLIVLFASFEFYAETGQAAVFDEDREVWVYRESWQDHRQFKVARSCNASSPSCHDVRFQSVPVSFWWAIVTSLSVGYGDFVPISYAGKVVAALVIALTILILALPITLLGENFRDEFALLVHHFTNREYNGKNVEVNLSGRGPLLKPKDRNTDKKGTLSAADLYKLYLKLQHQTLETVPHLVTQFEESMLTAEEIHETFDYMEHVIEEIAMTDEQYVSDTDWTDTDWSDDHGDDNDDFSTYGCDHSRRPSHQEQIKLMRPRIQDEANSE